MIGRDSFKGVPSVVIDTGSLKAVFLPENGGKLASLTDKETGTELLEQAPGKEYLSIGMDSSYIDGECSAFDDMFPTIDPQDGGYPDHGEVCRAKHKCVIGDGYAEFSYDSVLLPYRYEKRISASPDGGLETAYRITNLSDRALPCLWAGHIMLAGSEGAEVIIPCREGAPATVCFCDNGDLVPGSDIGFTRELAVQMPFSATAPAYKFYLKEPADRGELVCKRYRDGIFVSISYDASKLPYVGLWMNNGTFKGMYNAAVEMCTAPFDSPEKAEAKGYRAALDANEILEFTLTFRSGRL